MISFEESLKIINSVSHNIETELIDIKNSLGRILAENVYSDINMPPFNKSAVDGFACRKLDLNNELIVIETIQAGMLPQNEVNENQCSQIMTGASVPKGADYVIMIEDVEFTAENKIRSKILGDRQNICFLGEDIKINQLVFEKGTLITPSVVGTMATIGYTNCKVAKVPVVGILSTGNEIVEPYQIPNQTQIRNCNSYQLIAQIENIGAVPIYLGIVEDTEEATFKAISRAVESCDIILLTGGVSMGKFDLVPQILKDFGFETKFHKVAIQPGKPTLFATYKNKQCFGLPGNPVSAYVLFELMAKPLIFSRQGNKYSQKVFKFEIGSDFKRKKADRKAFIPVFFNTEGKVLPVEYHGSAHINSLSVADGLMEIEIGTDFIRKGEMVNVRQL